MRYKKYGGCRHTNYNSSNKKTITLRISTEQFKELERRAARVGMNRSDYCRNLLFNESHEDQWPKQHFASNLCKHHFLIDKIIAHADVRQQLYDWEANVWQLLK